MNKSILAKVGVLLSLIEIILIMCFAPYPKVYTPFIITIWVGFIILAIMFGLLSDKFGDEETP